jgi:hypothetical protein
LNEEEIKVVTPAFFRCPVEWSHSLLIRDRHIRIAAQQLVDYQSEIVDARID